MAWFCPMGRSKTMRWPVMLLKMFFRWEDRNNQRTKTYAFSGRNSKGANELEAAFPSMGHNAMMAHSIRGRVSPTQEGPRYCVSCHMTTDGLAEYGDLYNTFRAATGRRTPRTSPGRRCGPR